MGQLLPQPGGFEGLVFARVLFDPPNLPVPHPVGPGLLHVKLDAPPGAEKQRHDNPFANFDELAGLELQGCPNGSEALPAMPQAVDPLWTV